MFSGNIQDLIQIHPMIESTPEWNLICVMQPWLQALNTFLKIYPQADFTSSDISMDSTMYDNFSDVHLQYADQFIKSNCMTNVHFQGTPITSIAAALGFAHILIRLLNNGVDVNEAGNDLLGTPLIAATAVNKID